MGHHIVYQSGGTEKKQNEADQAGFCDKTMKATKKAPDMEGRPINPAGTHAPEVVKHRKEGESLPTIEKDGNMFGRLTKTKPPLGTCYNAAK